MDKPDGPTSHDVVARARRLFHTRAVGHAGTLDPFATGLLVLVFGGATRLARWAERHPKTYLAVARLGVTTETDDRTGAVLESQEASAWPEPGVVDAALRELARRTSQRPPAYSARKIGGERSYRIARRGGKPEPEAAPVTVHQLELVEYAPPLVTFRTVLSPGGYVRALGRDLGELLGTGAHLTGLRRERIGPWQVADATALASMTGKEPLLPARSLVGELPGVWLTEDEEKAVVHGRNVLRDGPTDGEAALLAGDRLVAVATAVPEGWHPAVVLG